MEEMPNTLQIFEICPIDRPPSQPLKTGQTLLYEPGDDGDLEEGIARDYTILTTGLYSGTTDIVINAKTHALSNNCVIDNSTDLMWARFVPLGDIGPDSNGKLLWKDAANAEDIWSFLAQANANSLAGYNDWRVPNHFELASILDLGTSNPCIDTTTFPSTPAAYHWTSSTHPTNSAYAFNVNFTIGSVFDRDKGTAKFSVRLVRG